MANHFIPLRTETPMIDRRILLASAAGLFGLFAFRWLRATPAQAADGSVQCVKNTHDIVSKFDPGGQPIRKTGAAIAGACRKRYAKPENPFISDG